MNPLPVDLMEIIIVVAQLCVSHGADSAAAAANAQLSCHKYYANCVNSFADKAMTYDKALLLCMTTRGPFKY